MSITLTDLANPHVKTPIDVDNDAVNRPSHYTSHPEGVECIQVTRHMTFNLGNAVKYIWRAGKKGDEVEDLRKAAWYINDEIERLRPPHNFVWDKE
jgi:hypothetical protein